jgi:adenylate cyclase
VRIAEALDRAGIELEDLSAMIAVGEYTTSWADLLFPDPVPSETMTLAEAIEEQGLPEGLVHRLFTIAWQVPMPAMDEPLRADDLEMLRLAGLAHRSLGADEEITLGATRYFGDNLRRVAESQMRFFRKTVEEPLIEKGMSQWELMQFVSEMGALLMPAAFRAVDLLARRHLESFLVEDIVTNTEIAMEHAGRKQRRLAKPPAIAFLDLSGYTRLTEEQGDDAAAELTERFSELVSHAADHHGGRAVKFLGDGVMFHFLEPAGAVRCGLDLVHEAPAAGLPAAHVGLHVGPVVFRDGDFFGRTVNLAARVTGHAGPGEVLVTAEGAEAAAADDLAFEPLPPAGLKGIAEPVAVFRASRT